MKKLKFFALLTALTLILSGCGQEKKSNESTAETAEVSTNQELSKTDGDMFTDRDYETEYDASTSVLIKLNGDSVLCNSDKVQVSDSTVTIKDEGTYIISGTLDDGMIIVDAEKTDKPQIVLDGASITSKTSAPLYILSADKVFVTLADNSENTLDNGGSFEAVDESNIDGAVFSKQDLTFNGSGVLTVNSPSGHGIVCKDDLVFTSGTYSVNSASHGLDVNDSVRVCDASISLDAGKDGIHSENSDDTSLGFVYISSGNIEIEAEGDGISAYAYAQINGGTFDILAGGGSENGSSKSSENYGGFMGGGPGGRGGESPRGFESRGGFTDIDSGNNSSSSDAYSEESTSMKGIKAVGELNVINGTFNINSADDALHSNGSLTVNGGSFEIASGDDGLHADESLTITDGKINITESYEGLEALDVKISGGDIKLVASDDGLNAAGGTDSSGTEGGRDGMFGGGNPGGKGGGMSSSSNGSITISGGTLYINASGDGIDANGSFEISGGSTTVVGPTQGDTATLDYDVSGIITGGTFIGTGASNMAQSFSEAKNQGVLALSVGNQSAETQIIIKDSKGNTIISHTPELSYQVVIISSPEIKSGETYKVTIGSTTNEIEAE